MGFIEAVLANLVADTLWLGVATVFVARGVFRRAASAVALMSTVHRRTLIRFSASAVLRVTSGQDYLVVKTPARGKSLEYWGPLGGVIKCKSGASKRLADIEVTFDVLADQSTDMDRDLRVKMSGKRFWRFIRWYWSADGRESPEEALKRELKEELREIGLEVLIPDVDQAEIEMSRLCSSGLFKQDAIYHYRLFYVFELVGPDGARFRDELLGAVGPGALSLVSPDKIRTGAHDNVSVGGHCCFLLPGAKYEHRMPAYQ
jgi:hypothetical protein